VRLQAIMCASRIWDSACLQAVNFERLDIVTCMRLHVSNSRLSSVCLQNVHYQMVTIKLELSASHVCSVCNISRQLQFSVSGWTIPISWIYLIIRFGYIPNFGRRMPDLQVLYY